MRSWFLFAMALSAYDEVIVFGDSLSDTGNYFRDISNGTFPDPDYSFHGRFSNGPVWVEYLALSLHANLTNYACASSTSDGDIFPANDARIPGYVQQIEGFLQTKPNVTARTLVVVASMGNDFYNPNATMPLLLKNIKRGTDRLINEAGAKNFLFLINGAPDIYPAFEYMPAKIKSQFMSAIQDALPTWSDYFNNMQAEFPNVNAYYMNYREALLTLKSNLRVDKGCASDVGLLKKPEVHDVCPDPENFLFWDGVHPTTRAHQLIAEKALLTLA